MEGLCAKCGAPVTITERGIALVGRCERCGTRLFLPLGYAESSAVDTSARTDRNDLSAVSEDRAEQFVLCSTCGKGISEDSEFCYHCGADLSHTAGTRVPPNRETRSASGVADRTSGQGTDWRTSGSGGAERGEIPPGPSPILEGRRSREVAETQYESGSTEARSAKVEGAAVGLASGVAAGGCFFIAGLLLTVTGIGAIIGIPMMIGAFLGPLIGLGRGAEKLKGDCPYCGMEIEAEHANMGVTCRVCKQRVIVRKQRFCRVDKRGL
jgi:DNA-directed RNA polymerase subunit RPC12/RpoP